jgi:Protein of unknown function (DUF3047)
VKTVRRLGIAATLGLVPVVAQAALPLTMDVHFFRFIKSESGPVNYYTVVEDAAHGAYLHASYAPPMETGVMGYELQSDADKEGARTLRWSWRAVTLPNGGNECASGKEDSAADVYVIWKRGLRYYTLKYVWSAVGTKGAVCDKRRNPFLAQDTVILETGGPLNTWVTEQIDLKAEFRKHFEDGNADAEVPPYKAIGIMTDGDQTKSPSSADYGPFVVL